jgi:plastocyanin
MKTLRLRNFARQPIIFIAVVAGLSLGAHSEPASPVEVRIDNFSFSPATLTVSVGTAVTWTNRDDIPHTVADSAGEFKSKVMDTDEKFSYTFSKAGTYSYFCSIHPKMMGKIIVQ